MEWRVNLFVEREITSRQERRCSNSEWKLLLRSTPPSMELQKRWNLNQIVWTNFQLCCLTELKSRSLRIFEKKLVAKFSRGEEILFLFSFNARVSSKSQTEANFCEFLKPNVYLASFNVVLFSPERIFSPTNFLDIWQKTFWSSHRSRISQKSSQ